MGNSNKEVIILNELKWLKNWYLKHCDGDWEHYKRINISTLDNPGWTVEINVSDTNLEDKRFDTVDIERSDDDWIYCNAKDNLFEGNGGVNNLEEILDIFKDWAIKNNE
jgi:hypothetical protein